MTSEALQEAQKRRRAGFLRRLATVLLVPPAVALLAHRVERDQARPVPAAYDTLARFLPSDAVVLDVDPTSTDGIHRFEASRPGQTYRGEVTAEGTLLWLSSPARVSVLPESLRESLLSDSSAPEPRVERVRILAYRVSGAASDGAEIVRFLDARGNALFHFEDLAEAQDGDGVEELSDLAGQVTQTLRPYLGGTPPTRVRQEQELGSTVHAVRWRSRHGEQEVKILESGLTLLLELADDEPVPPAVLAQVPREVRVTPTILEAYWLRDREGQVSKAVLANFIQISPPQSHRAG